MRISRPLIIGTAIALSVAALLAPVSQAAQGTGEYIVVLKDDASPATVAARHKNKHDVEVKHLYKYALKGYAARIKGSELAALRKDTDVAFIEEDAIATIAKPGGKKPGGSDPAPAPGVASWGLDRIDQRDLPLDGAFNPRGDGARVTAYVLDTGVHITHVDFGGRASYGRDVIDGDDVSSDCHGHGTHVAGTIGGATYGVAKAVNIVAVRVLNCAGSGTWSGIAAGLDWVVGHESGTPKVANLSIGGPGSDAMDLAIANATAEGVTVVVAAGNESTNACNRSPARAPSAITVGATTSSDARASYSNYGPCLDIFAPGSSIKSAWKGSDTATKTISGTSMATPHTAGMAALALSAGSSPAQVTVAILAGATKDRVTGIATDQYAGTPNLLLYAGN